MFSQNVTHFIRKKFFPVRMVRVVAAMHFSENGLLWRTLWGSVLIQLGSTGTGEGIPSQHGSSPGVLCSQSPAPSTADLCGLSGEWMALEQSSEG